jgi:phospholipid/cholesterol/gamma-HCH transport system permease protein
MGTMTILRGAYPRLARGLTGRWAGCRGSAITPCSTAAPWAAPHAAVHYRREIIRLIAEISMGAGTLAMIGGTVVIVGFLTLAAGGTLAVQGYSSLGNIGIEALTGFLAFIQCASVRRWWRDRVGGHLRGRGDRPVGGDADQ